MKTTARALLAFAFLATSSVLSAQIAFTGETLGPTDPNQSLYTGKTFTGSPFTSSYAGSVLFTVRLDRAASATGFNDTFSFQNGGGTSWFTAGTTGNAVVFDSNILTNQTSYVSVLVDYTAGGADSAQAWVSSSNFATFTPGVGIGNTGALAWSSTGDFSLTDIYAVARQNTTLSFSNVQYTVIPEPSTYALAFGAATLAVVGYRRFRKGAN